MPYINVQTNVTVTPAQADALKTRLDKDIAAIPGKSESWLMVSISGGQAMYFQGSAAPCAMADISIFGHASAEAFEKLTQAVTASLKAELNLEPARIYTKYSEVENWGWNGGNF